MMITDLEVTCPLRCGIYLKCLLLLEATSCFRDKLLPNSWAGNQLCVFFIYPRGVDLKANFDRFMSFSHSDLNLRCFPWLSQFCGVCACVCRFIILHIIWACMFGSRGVCDCLLVLVRVFICGSLQSAVNTCSCNFHHSNYIATANSHDFFGHLCCGRNSNPWRSSVRYGAMNFCLHATSWKASKR